MFCAIDFDVFIYLTFSFKDFIRKKRANTLVHPLQMRDFFNLVERTICVFFLIFL